VNARAGITKNARQAVRRLARARLSPGQGLFVSALLFCAFLCLAALSRFPSLITQSDWLINYAGGFVRRGLAGSLLIPAGEWIGASPFAMVTGALVVCYMVITLMSIHLVRHPKPAPWALALALLSPSVLLFQVENGDRSRKEILLIAWAGVMAWRSVERKPLPGKAALALTLLVFTALHDGFIFFCPALILFLMALHPDKTWTLKDLALALAPALLLTLGTAWIGPSGEAQIHSIVGRFHGDYALWNGYSIACLRESPAKAAAMVWEQFAPHKLIVAALALLLGALPLLIWLAADARAKIELKILARRPHSLLLISLALLSQAVLFALTTDWGRWISIDLFLGCFALLSIYQRRNPPGRQERCASWPLLILGLALYVGTWRMSDQCNGFYFRDALQRLLPAQPLLPHIWRFLP
jgi:hypothetical protein